MSCCAHCGRTDTIMGHLSCGMVSVGLCHAEPGVTVGAVLARRYGRSSRTTENCPTVQKPGALL
jgi:hypothetical protein